MTERPAIRTGAGFAGVILAAGLGRRFGGGKMRAPLDGRPLVGHVLAAAHAARLDPVILVLGHDAAEVRAALLRDPRALDGVTVLVNPAPERGLSSSLRLGFDRALASDPRPAGVLILLGDQPRVDPATIRALIEAAKGTGGASGSAGSAGSAGGRIAVAPLHRADASPNPVLLLPSARPAVEALTGDRGLGPLLAARPDLVLRVAVPGDNPDVDSPADLAVLEAPRER